jgi:hypothetical protein
MGAPPKNTDRLVGRFCHSISPEEKPVFIPVVPLADGEQNDCFVNVEKKMATDGGSQIFGWAIWEWPGVFIEAEFHSVWKSPEGHLVDVSPNVPPFPWILFLPDPNRKYKGAQIDNIRKACRKDPIIREFIENAKAIYREKNKGDLKYFVGELDNPSPELLALAERKMQIEQQMAPLYGEKLFAAIEDRLSCPQPENK